MSDFFAQPEPYSSWDGDRLVYFCPDCSGRGWVLEDRKGAEWAVPCKSCGGKGKFKLGTLAKWLDEDPTLILRMENCRCRKETSLRVLDRILSRWPAFFASPPSSRSSPSSTTRDSSGGPYLFD